MSVRKVGVVCPLSYISEKYSVSGVVLDHLNILVNKGFEVTFFTADDWEGVKSIGSSSHNIVLGNVNIVKLPRFCTDGAEERDLLAAKGWVDSVKDEVFKALENNKQDIYLFHDVFFIDSFLPWNILWKEFFKKSPARVLSIAHSAPSKPDFNNPFIAEKLTLPDNTLICSLNRTDIPRFSKMYRKPENEIVPLYNPVFPDRYWTEDARTIYKEYKLWSYPYIFAYAGRIHPSKQLVKMAKILNSFPEENALLMIGSYANSEETKAYVREIKANHPNVFITSEKEEFELGVDHKTVVDLFEQVDGVIMTSLSEAHSRLMSEAALKGCFMVFNDDIPSLKEFAGRHYGGFSYENGTCIPFGSVSRPIVSYNPGESEWLEEHSRIIHEDISACKAVQHRRHTRLKFSPDIWYWNYLEPLL